MGRVARGAAGAAGLLAAAEITARAGLIDPLLSPPASAVLARSAALATDPGFLHAAAATLMVWGRGWGLAVIFAIPAGAVLGSVPRAEAAFRLVLEFLRPLPAVALVPLAVLILQDDIGAQVAVIAWAASWPVLLNTLYGMREVDPLTVETVRSFGFSPVSVVYRVALPAAAPFIATGVRLAAASALIVAISTELLTGGGAGIGTLVLQAGSGGDGTAVVMAATVWAGVLGLTVDTVLALVQRRLLRWHSTRQAQAV
jgi:NitT/TauT family transport system permease protein